MPLEKVVRKGFTCWRWGSKGKVYCGEGARRKALKQGYAEDPSHFKEEMDKSSAAALADYEAVVAEIIEHGPECLAEEFLNPVAEAVRAYVSTKERDKLDSSDFGWPEEKKFPANTKERFDSAVRLIGHAPKDKQEMIKQNLIRIARKRGWAIPKSWEK